MLKRSRRREMMPKRCQSMSKINKAVSTLSHGMNFWPPWRSPQCADVTSADYSLGEVFASSQVGTARPACTCLTVVTAICPAILRPLDPEYSINPCYLALQVRAPV